ncbi:MAG: hydantoinase/oxoprolinase family protein, partial [Mariprofundaceae bacterium]
AGSMSLHVQAARDVVQKIAQPLALSIEEAAAGIIRIAEEHMAGALRVVSVQRGFDPKDFALLCFGGAGGLHACALADQLGIGSVIFPVGSGAFSALGMLVGKRQSELSRSRRLALTAPDILDQLALMIDQLKVDAKKQLAGLELSFDTRLDLCYAGQGFHLSLPYQNDMQLLQQQFEDEHEASYGHRLQRPVEVMTVRLTAYADSEDMPWKMLKNTDQPPVSCASSHVYDVGDVPHYQRDELRPNHQIFGPALVLEDTATLWLDQGWKLEVSTHGHLILNRIISDSAS